MEYHLSTQEITVPPPQFWKTIELWINNPHLINRRVLSSVTLSRSQLSTPDALLDRLQHIPVEKLSASPVLPDIFPLATSSPEDIDPFATPEGHYLFIRKLFPRDEDNFSTTVDFFILDKSKSSVTWVSRSLDPEKRCLGFQMPCRITLQDKNLRMSIGNNSRGPAEDATLNWLKERLFPRLVKWMEADPPKNNLVEGSLNLVSPEKYTNLYNSLKKKYGTELVDKWPECTDPAKFVYEDIAIASYLILLWEEERREKGIDEKQSFLDLGCGNGLLVFILTSEGYPGVGIDLRRRKIWDLFGDTRLEEKTIIPSSKSLFPTTDWLIGNHSDELTPWIPVIAARSSYSCRFFLLPCCAHEFDGRKFQRESASSSQYSEYLRYIRKVCETCGFSTKLDKLRIPSTKRICLIGVGRNYPEVETDSQDEKIEEMISARSLSPQENEKASDEWARDFKPREIVERVRNCTQVDRNVINEIVELVSTELLRKTRKITLNRPGDSEGLWNAGGQLELNEIARLVPPESLKQLKNECGGLQTLMKNNSHIFQVTNGSVQFRIPGSPSNSKRKKSGRSKIVLRVKPCWFFDNHPDGCPLPDETCNFKHSPKVVIN
ncbi:probable tRNA (uracil-O(2)-)-methyltransferase [Diachasma alloeum]|uniref:probable tRNA (uracil-O(2)-)-methyltransferase n=1 Tax=Diachasma alloeum TaxID=454923 RepID=UPI00073829D4|nr:probable tRNA (uracil-O(2)-)-methyltransferase [Diachasma alloeum]XP_028982262.1 probable tRNA (uracil-O(2)-)-methyltransferase [Diachasma alloeum]XP_028982263.1 probable tRNA (uracil-O(2)-)-methyltransferase [Diachasma alloeum]